MDYQPWMEYITAKDMPNDDLKFVAENAGIKAALALIFCTPGLTVNIPKNAFKAVKKRYILNNYDGTRYSINKLALECNLSQRYVYKIIRKNFNQNK